MPEQSQPVHSAEIETLEKAPGKRFDSYKDEAARQAKPQPSKGKT